MSDDDWISSQEAHRRAKAAGATEDDLLEWAGLGKLRARAKSGIFSSDLASEMDNARDCERTFPIEPPADELTRETLGPWPDVPVDFWADKPTKATWAAGTFASRVYYWSDYHQARMDEHIELFDVTFHAGDLAGLLSELLPPVEPLRGVMPASAKANDRLYEEHAHRAAELVRSEKIKPSKAFRRALAHKPPAPGIEMPSQERALRTSYGLMYDQLGMPHPK
jgi:hypothetical protein